MKHIILAAVTSLALFDFGTDDETWVKIYDISADKGTAWCVKYLGK